MILKEMVLTVDSLLRAMPDFNNDSVVFMMLCTPLCSTEYIQEITA
jgi:hypothetical protein